MACIRNAPILYRIRDANGHLRTRIGNYICSMVADINVTFSLNLSPKVLTDGALYRGKVLLSDTWCARIPLAPSLRSGFNLDGSGRCSKCRYWLHQVVSTNISGRQPELPSLPHWLVLADLKKGASLFYKFYHVRYLVFWN